MVAACDARSGARHKDLTDMRGFEQLRQFTPGVGSLGQGIGEGVRGKIRDVRCIKGVDQGITHIRHGQADPAFPETPDRFRKSPQRGAIRRFDLAIFPVLNRRHSIHHVDKCAHDIIDINQFDFFCRIGNCDGKIMSDIMAEGGHHGVVIGAAPFAENTGQTEDGNLRPGFFPKGKDFFFRMALGNAVGIIQKGLHGRGEQEQGFRPSP